MTDTPAQLLEDMATALDHLVQDVENHADGDDRGMTLDITGGRARAVLQRYDTYTKEHPDV